MARKKTETEENQVVVAYEKTPQELEAIEAILAARGARLPAPKIKVTEDREGRGVISMDHANPALGGSLLGHALATTSMDFTSGILNQISTAVSKGQKPSEDAINFALAVIAGVKPKDEIETLLATQMSAIHCAMIEQTGRMNRAEYLPQMEAAERAVNRLGRTFVAQMEALKRYRTGGEQKVTVHHVTVNEGGQAIVGTVERSGDRGEG